LGKALPGNTVHVQVQPRYLGRARPGQLRAAARAALIQQAVAPPAELTIVVAGDALLRKLNRQFLGIDAPTDVLSFPAQSQTGEAYLGDIAISFPRARAQAAAAGHPVEAELRLLAVHGVLHLLGHDHARPGEKKRMWAAQDTILKGLSTRRK
jgi:probable rRNA maturation factor